MKDVAFMVFLLQSFMNKYVCRHVYMDTSLYMILYAHIYTRIHGFVHLHFLTESNILICMLEPTFFLCMDVSVHVFK